VVVAIELGVCHARMSYTRKSAAKGKDVRLGQCSGVTPERLALSRGVSATFGRDAGFGDSMRADASWVRPR
jgi:hypothetical protein